MCVECEMVLAQPRHILQGGTHSNFMPHTQGKTAQDHVMQCTCTQNNSGRVYSSYYRELKEACFDYFRALGSQYAFSG